MDDTERHAAAMSAHARAEEASRRQHGELAELRRALAARDVECAKLERDLAEERARAAELAAELARRDRTVEVVTKELVTRKQFASKLEAENDELRTELSIAVAASQRQQLQQRLAQEREEREPKRKESPSARYLSLCLDCDCDPDTSVLRSLHLSDEITSSRPLSFSELAALDEVVCRVEHAAPDAPRWDGYRIGVAAENGYPQLAALVSGNPALARVEVAGVTDRGLRTLLPSLEAAERLAHLRLPRPAQLGDDAVSGVVRLFHARARGAAAHRAPSEPPAPPYLKIEELDLRGGALLGATIESIQMDTLLRLDLSGQENLTDGVLEQVVLNCRMLRCLAVAGAAAVTEKFLEFLNKHGERVVELDVAGCAALRSLRLHHVQRLGTDLVGVHCVHAPSLTHFTRTLTMFPAVELHCPQLCRLALDGVVLRDREFRVIGGGVGTALRELVLIRCRVAGLRALLSRLRCLTRVALRDCQGVTDSDVASLPGCVEALDLAGCYYLTDDGVDLFTTNCPGVRSLSLQRVSNLTDRGVDLVAQRCGGLVTANLLGCQKVSVLAVDRLVSHCPGLETVMHDSYRSVKLDARGDDPLGDDLLLLRGGASAAEVVLDWLRRSAVPGALQLAKHAPYSTAVSAVSPQRRLPAPPSTTAQTPPVLTP